MLKMFISQSAAKAWESWISLGLACLYTITTQLYTRIFTEVLFPPDTEQQLQCDSVDTNKPELEGIPEEGEPQIEAQGEKENQQEGEPGLNLKKLGQFSKYTKLTFLYYDEG